MSHDVFISYSSKDKPIADGVCATLEQQGLRCWIAPRDILPGEEWSAAIIRALEGSRAFVLVFSKSANESNQIKREVERAVHHGLPIIPYRIEDVQPTDTLEYFISTPHWMDAFSPPIERHAVGLAEAIKRLLGAPAPPTPSPPAPQPAPAPPNPAPAPANRSNLPLLLGAAAVGVLVLAAVGYVLLAPHPPSPVAGGGPSFTGNWTVAKVAWNSEVPTGYRQTTLGELFAAVMTANKTGGTFQVTPSGDFQTVIEVDDAGTVSRLGPALQFVSAGGATAVVAERRLPGAPFGGQPGETGLLLTGLGRIPEPWVGLPDPAGAFGPLRGVAGTWRSANWPMLPDGQLWTATLTIQPGGVYSLKLFQKVAGALTTTAAGTWSASVRGPGGALSATNGGSYAFNGPSLVTMTSPQGSTTWAKAQ